ncbi:MAG: tetratricopeptide repeat protein [Deltaproteobacteria bacterium]|nr:tetratricopeptide repeat protein [Deltaproteobacteria bacterium]
MDANTLHIGGIEFNILALLGFTAILGLVIGYFLGKRKQFTDSSRKQSNSPEDYSVFFKGIQYILANETDQAIEAFSRAVQVNSETIETYVTLGNLFRVKGEIDRAIRIRQTILLREKVDEKTKLQALFDMGMDYKQGGFLQRAISTFEEVLRRAPKWLDAYKELEGLYEATHDWQRAYEIQKEIGKLSNRNNHHIMAHLKTEQAKIEMEKGNLDSANAHLKKALSLDPTCVDASLQLGSLYWLKNKKKKALATWKKLIKNNPRWAHLILNRLEEQDGMEADEAKVFEFLEKIAEENLDPLARLALARCFMKRDRREQGLASLRRALEIKPDLGEARKILGEVLLENGDEKGALSEYRILLDHLGPTTKSYRCQQCGLESDKIAWKCPGCHNWDTVQPRKVAAD